MELLREAFIFLAAGVIAVPIASRLGLGSVLGYLIAGTLIGPFALGFVSNTENIMHFAEFGVVMMLFLIGLELKPALLWRMRSPILGLGGLQVVITTAVIALIVMLLLQNWRTSIAIGLTLSLSSTAIVLQILSEKHLMSTEGGKSSFAVLLFQDIAVIPIIAILPLLAISSPGTIDDANHTGSAIAHLAGWQQTIIVIMVVAGIIFAGRFLMRPLFRFIAESRLREMFTATALLLVVGIALLMHTVGLSPALGSFIAGVVLANSEYRHELEANIDPFKALLLGLFFISIGAGIDFELLTNQPLLISAIVLGLIGIKFVILWALAKFYRIKGGDRYWFAFTLPQGGEFGFVLLSFSLQSHVLDNEIVDILTLSIALSMVLTPILVLLNERFVQIRFQEQVQPEAEEDMDEQDNPVIIAGFGRFGQIIGRLLMANGITVTVLDNSAVHIEQVRRFGYKVYYGDAARADLLHTAGADKAKLLIVAIDDRDQIRSIIETAKHNFPHLKILTRAYDVVHFHELQNLGVDHIERELFLGSLKVGETALRTLGMRANQARRKALQFAKHDQDSIQQLGEHQFASQHYISASRRAQDEVLELLQEDRLHPEETSGHDAWDAIGHD